VIFEIVGSHQKSRVSRSDRQVGWLAPRSDTVRSPRSELAKLMVPAQHAAHNLLLVCFVWQFRASPIFSRHGQNLEYFCIPCGSRISACHGPPALFVADPAEARSSVLSPRADAVVEITSCWVRCAGCAQGCLHARSSKAVLAIAISLRDALHLGTHTCASRDRSQVADQQP
jgi:hypothetical protein